MATKYFCDYCGFEVQSLKGPIIMKMVMPGTGDECRTKVFHELCEGCYDQLQHQFHNFLEGLGDDSHEH